MLLVDEYRRFATGTNIPGTRTIWAGETPARTAFSYAGLSGMPAL